MPKDVSIDCQSIPRARGCIKDAKEWSEPGLNQRPYDGARNFSRTLSQLSYRTMFYEGSRKAANIKGPNHMGPRAHESLESYSRPSALLLGRSLGPWVAVRVLTDAKQD